MIRRRRERVRAPKTFDKTLTLTTHYEPVLRAQLASQVFTPKQYWLGNCHVRLEMSFTLFKGPFERAGCAYERGGWVTTDLNRGQRLNWCPTGKNRSDGMQLRISGSLRTGTVMNSCRLLGSIKSTLGVRND